MGNYGKSFNRNGRTYSEDLLKRINDNVESMPPVIIGGIENDIFVIDSLNTVYTEKDEKLDYEEQKTIADLEYKPLAIPHIDKVYNNEIIHPWDNDIDNREARRRNNEDGNDAVSWKEFNESIHCGVWWRDHKILKEPMDFPIEE